MMAAVLGVTNCVTLALLITAALRRRSNVRPYRIVEAYDGEYLEGPLTLREAERAQRRWNRIYMYHNGPRTKISTIGGKSNG